MKNFNVENLNAIRKIDELGRIILPKEFIRIWAGI